MYWASIDGQHPQKTCPVQDMEVQDISVPPAKIQWGISQGSPAIQKSIMKRYVLLYLAVSSNLRRRASAHRDIYDVVVMDCACLKRRPFCFMYDGASTAELLPGSTQICTTAALLGHIDVVLQVIKTLTADQSHFCSGKKRIYTFLDRDQAYLPLISPFEFVQEL